MTITRKSAKELNFIEAREPLPGLEVQAESLEQQGLYLGSILEEALSDLAAERPSAVATIYLSGMMSENFINEPGWSEFLTVAGDGAVLRVLFDAFSRLRNVRSRYSDYLLPRSGSATYHIEGGQLWQAEDVLTWYSVDRTEDQDAGMPPDGQDTGSEAAGLARLGNVPAGSEENAGTADTGDGLSDYPAPRRSGRLNAARSDASVATIRGTIEELFGLPAGSVALCGPDGRALRGDALIRTLRRRWEES
jgi:hypothetical protein